MVKTHASTSQTGRHAQPSLFEPETIRTMDAHQFLEHFLRLVAIRWVSSLAKGADTTRIPRYATFEVSVEERNVCHTKRGINDVVPEAVLA